MQIRKIRRNDLYELVPLYEKFLKQMMNFCRFLHTKKPSINKKELKKALKNRIDNSRDRIFLVAEDKDKLLGFIEAEIMSSKESKTKKRVIEIIDIYVENKRKGLGKKLFKEVEKWSKSKKAKFMQWDFFYENKLAENFCTKNKFKHFKTKMLKKLK